jgi:hypothetical protein
MSAAAATSGVSGNVVRRQEFPEKRAANQLFSVRARPPERQSRRAGKTGFDARKPDRARRGQAPVSNPGPAAGQAHINFIRHSPSNCEQGDRPRSPPTNAIFGKDLKWESALRYRLSQIPSLPK